MVYQFEYENFCLVPYLTEYSNCSVELDPEQLDLKTASSILSRRTPKCFTFSALVVFGLLFLDLEKVYLLS